MGKESVRNSKIAVFAGIFPKISESFVVEHLSGLISEDIDIDILAYRDSGNNEIHEKVKSFNLISRTSYFNIPENRILRVLKGFLLFLVYFWRYPSLIKAFNFRRYGRISLSWVLFYVYLDFLRNDRTYDLIHCHFNDTGRAAACLKDLDFDFKLVNTIHSSDNIGIRKDNIIYRKNVDLVIANSSFNKKRIIEDAGISKEKIILVNPAFNLEEFKNLERVKRDQDCFRILTVARLSEEKGLSDSIKAVSRIREDHNIKYDIVGGGNLKKELRDQIISLDAEEYIKLHGHVSEDEKLSFYRDADLFVLPSYNESFGVVLLEAQAAGLPIVATDVGGVSDSAAPSTSLCEAGDIDCLENNIREFIESNELRKETITKGLEHVEKFDNEKRTKKLLSLYQDLLNN